MDSDLLDLKGLQRVRILGVYDDVRRRLPGSSEFLVLLVDEALDGRAVLDGYFQAGEIVQPANILRVAFVNQQSLAGIHVIDEIDHFSALRLIEKLRDDGIAVLGLKRRDDAIERRVGKLGLDTEAPGDLRAEIDIGSDRLVVLVEIAERRARNVGAVDDLAGARDLSRRRDL